MRKTGGGKRFVALTLSGSIIVGSAILGLAQVGASGAPVTASTGARTKIPLTRVSTPTPSTVAVPSRTRRSIPVLRPNKSVHLSKGTITAGTPTVAGSAVVESKISQQRVIANFDGINALQNKKASGFDLEPPDEGLGAGNGYVVNFVNVTGAIYSSNGAMLTRPFYLNRFFGEPDTAFTSDPRVYFDPSSRRWFATILEADFNSAGTAVTGSRVDLAVSTTANPRGAWRIYRFDASNESHAGCPCLADFPMLGVNQTNVYISTNEFTSDLTSFNGAQLYAISKEQLLSGAAQVNSVLFPNLSVASTLAFQVQPANSSSPAPAEYLMSSLDPNGTGDNRIVVWAVTNERSVTTGNGIPTLSSRVIRSQPYSLPPNAKTPPGECTGDACLGGAGAPTTGVVSSNDDAMQEVQYINGRLVGALATAVTVAGDTELRAGIAWFVVRPAVNGSTVSSTTHIGRQGYVARKGEYLLFPHVNMGTDGSMAMVFGLGGPSTNLSAAYTTAKPGALFGAIRFAAEGVTSDNGFTGTAEYGGVGRWGDYSSGELVPGSNTIWLATQYIPNDGDGNANWGNRIFALSMYQSAATADSQNASPTNVSR